MSIKTWKKLQNFQNWLGAGGKPSENEILWNESDRFGFNVKCGDKFPSIFGFSTFFFVVVFGMELLNKNALNVPALIFIV